MLYKMLRLVFEGVPDWCVLRISCSKLGLRMLVGGGFRRRKVIQDMRTVVGRIERDACKRNGNADQIGRQSDCVL